MGPLQYTLLADGPSDRCLLRVIRWKLNVSGVTETIEQFADRDTVNVTRETLQLNTGKELNDRIIAAQRAFPCDLLFVHRDAEGDALRDRVSEITDALTSAGRDAAVPIVPVRMTEAWLFFNEPAIRQAAGNPNGQARLELPSDPESVVDPKVLLQNCLVVASEKKGRRLKQFRRDLAKRVYRIADYIDDFSPLKPLAAFAEFERSTERALDAFRTRTEK